MRVYAPLDDPIVEELDQAARKRGVSRAQMIINAIDSYLHQPEPSTEKLDQLRISLDQKNSELDQLRINVDQSKIEASNLKDELEQLKTKYNQTTSETTQRWEETKSLKKEIDKLKKELDEARSTSQQLKDDLLKKQSETDQVSKLREELAVAKTEVDKLKDAMKVRDDDIAFLRGHLSQISEKLPRSLPPSQEEAKAKHWWRFWKRG